MLSVTKIILERLDEDGIITDYVLASNIIDSILSDYHIHPLHDFPITATDLPEYIHTYLKVRHFEGLSKSTLRVYFYMLQELTFYINKPAKNITLNDLRQFLHYKSQNNSLSSISGIISCIKSFWDWLAMENLIDYNPAIHLHYPKYTHNTREGLSVIEIELCREACKTDRERAVFEFLLASGCRIGEIIDLLYSEVVTGEFHVLGKGSKVRYCYLNKKSLMYLERYHSRRKGESPYLFTQLRPPYQKVSIRALQDEISSIGKRCDIHLYPHRLRHTFASAALENGASLTTVQKILGHTKISTTQIYAKLSQASVKNEYLRYFNI